MSNAPIARRAWNLPASAPGLWVAASCCSHINLNVSSAPSGRHRMTYKTDCWLATYSATHSSSQTAQCKISGSRERQSYHGIWYRSTFSPFPHISNAAQAHVTPLLGMHIRTEKLSATPNPQVAVPTGADGPNPPLHMRAEQHMIARATRSAYPIQSRNRVKVSALGRIKEKNQENVTHAMSTNSPDRIYPLSQG